MLSASACACNRDWGPKHTTTGSPAHKSILCLAAFKDKPHSSLPCTQTHTHTPTSPQNTVCSSIYLNCIIMHLCDVQFRGKKNLPVFVLRSILSNCCYGPHQSLFFRRKKKTVYIYFFRASHSILGCHLHPSAGSLTFPQFFSLAPSHKYLLLTRIQYYILCGFRTIACMVLEGGKQKYGCFLSLS